MDSPLDVIENVSATASDSVKTVEKSLTDAVSDLSSSIRLQGDVLGTHSQSLNRMEMNIADMVNTVNEAMAKLTTSAVEIVSDAAQVAADVPAAGAETIEAVVESPEEEPKKIRRKKRYGRRRT